MKDIFDECKYNSNSKRWIMSCLIHLTRSHLIPLHFIAWITALNANQIAEYNRDYRLLGHQCIQVFQCYNCSQAVYKANKSILFDAMTALARDGFHLWGYNYRSLNFLISSSLSSFLSSSPLSLFSHHSSHSLWSPFIFASLLCFFLFYIIFLSRLLF